LVNFGLKKSRNQITKAEKGSRADVKKAFFDIKFWLLYGSYSAIIMKKETAEQLKMIDEGSALKAHRRQVKDV
jgi:hypothetical protein